MSKYDKDGREIMDPTPVQMPIGFKRPPTLQEQIRYLMRQEDFRRALAAQEMETLDEADDFDVGDDYDPSSPWELEFDPATGKEMLPAELRMLEEARGDFDYHVEESKKRKKSFSQEEPRSQPKKEALDPATQEPAE